MIRRYYRIDLQSLPEDRMKMFYRQFKNTLPDNNLSLSVSKDKTQGILKMVFPTKADADNFDSPFFNHYWLLERYMTEADFERLVKLMATKNWKDPD